MSILVIGFVVVIIALLIWVIVTYNKFKREKVAIQESWSTIDVQLKRKANILQNLVDTLKMQMNFESGVLKEITEARSGLTSSDHTEAMKANDHLTKLMPTIQATAESYPALGTNASFLQMMADIRDCEDKVAYARTRYNATVARYNMDIQVIPGCIVASQMKLQAEPLFEVSQETRNDADNMRISQL